MDPGGTGASVMKGRADLLRGAVLLGPVWAQVLLRQTFEPDPREELSPSWVPALTTGP